MKKKIHNFFKITNVYLLFRSFINVQNIYQNISKYISKYIEKNRNNCDFTEIMLFFFLHIFSITHLFK